MDTLEKFKRHIGTKVKFSITSKSGEVDDFELNPLDTEQFAELMVLSEKVADAKGNLPEEDKKKLVSTLLGLYVNILRSSYPDLDEVTANAFVTRNYFQFIDVLDEMMPANATEDQRKKLKAKIEMMQNARLPKQNTEHNKQV